MNYRPYLLRSSSSPVLRRRVCLVPSMADSVPSGKDALVSGMNVTTVRDLCLFVSVIPWVALLPTIQPSFLNSLISCLPDSAGIFVNLGSYQLPQRLNVRSYKGFRISRYGNCDASLGPTMVKLDIVFLEESFAFSNVFKSIQVQHNSFLKLPLCFGQRASKRRCAKFLTSGNPTSVLLMELKADHYITKRCWHTYPPLTKSNYFYITIYAFCQQKNVRQKVIAGAGGGKKQ